MAEWEGEGIKYETKKDEREGSAFRIRRRIKQRKKSNDMGDESQISEGGYGN